MNTAQHQPSWLQQVNVCICVDVYVCMHVCSMYVCMYVCVCAYVSCVLCSGCVCGCFCKHQPSWFTKCMHLCVAWICPVHTRNTKKHQPSWLHKYIHTCMCVCRGAGMYVCVSKFMHVYVHVEVLVLWAGVQHQPSWLHEVLVCICMAVCVCMWVCESVSFYVRVNSLVT